MVEVIPLKYGVTFKRVFSQPEIFKQFIFDLLGIQLEIDVVQTEYEYPESVGYVRIKYDLFAEDTNHRTIIEVQHIKHQDFFDRFLYYHLIGMIEQARTYQGYRFGRSVYTIVVLTSVPDDDSITFSHAVQDLSFLSEFDKRFTPYPHRLIVLAPRNVNEKTPPGIKAWLELIKDSLDSRLDETDYPLALFQQVIAAIKRNTITPDELAQIKDQESWAMTEADLLKKGRLEGRVEGQQAMARQMLAFGEPIEKIALYTQLSQQEIEQLVSQ
jgi:predicted transposase/invertase (TIGR01784 family)